MPLEIITEGIIGSMFRLIGWIFFEVIIEMLVKGLGFILVRPFRKIDLDSMTSLIVGLAAWVVVIATAIFIINAV